MKGNNKGKLLIMFLLLFISGNSLVDVCVNSPVATCATDACTYYYYDDLNNCTSCAKTTNETVCQTCSNYNFVSQVCLICSSTLNSDNCAQCPLWYYDPNINSCVSCVSTINLGGLNQTYKNACATGVGSFLKKQKALKSSFQVIMEKTLEINCAQFIANTSCIASLYCAWSPSLSACISCFAVKTSDLCSACSGFYFLNSTQRCVSCTFAAQADCNFNCPGYNFNSSQTACLPTAKKNCLTATQQFCTDSCTLFYFDTTTKKCTPCYVSLRTNMPNVGFIYTSYIGSIFNSCLKSFAAENGCSATSQAGCSNETCVTYFLDSSGSCVPCNLADPVLCKTCTSFSFNNITQTCIACSSKLDASSCSFCPLYFNTSNNKQPCISCIDQLVTTNGLTDDQKSFCVASIANNLKFQSSSKTVLRIVIEYTALAACRSFKNGTICSSNPLCFYSSVSLTCFACSSLKEPSSCSQCPWFFYSKKVLQCLSCALATQDECASCVGFVYDQNILLCRLVTKSYCSSANASQSTCNNACPFMFYNTTNNAGTCTPCSVLNRIGSTGYTYTASIGDTLIKCQNSFINNNLNPQGCNSFNSTGCKSDACLNFYFDENSLSCISCDNADALFCQKCSSYTFNSATKKCTLCSSNLDEVSCSTCPLYYFDLDLFTCTPCTDILSGNVIPFDFTLAYQQCAESVQQYSNQISNAKLPFQIVLERSIETICKKLTAKLCLTRPFCYLFNSVCLPCSAAKTSASCNRCPWFYFNLGKCTPCALASTSILCNQCSNHTFSSINGVTTCIPTKKQFCLDTLNKVSQETCLNACPFFFYNVTALSCNFCSSLNLDLIRTTNLVNESDVIGEVIDCSSSLAKFNSSQTFCDFVNQLGCSADICNDYYFDQKASLCIACSKAGLKDCISCNGFYWNSKSNNCIKCSSLLTDSDDCNSCPMYYFDSLTNSCISCSSQVELTVLNNKNISIHAIPCAQSVSNNLNSISSTKSVLEILIQSTSITICASLNSPSQCKLNSLCYYTFNANKCTPCYQANNPVSCALCKNNYFDTTLNVCASCRFTDAINCNDPSKCPEFAYNDTLQLCLRTYRKACISSTSQSICRNYCPLFYFDSTSSTCSSCSILNNILQLPITNNTGFVLQACQRSIFNISETQSDCQANNKTICNSDNCFDFYYESKINACISCKYADLVRCAYNCFHYTFNVSSKTCVKCVSTLDKIACNGCRLFYFDSSTGTCESCIDNIRNDIAKVCSNNLQSLLNSNRSAFQFLSESTMVRLCLQIISKDICNLQPLCYFSSPIVGCISCSESTSLASCSLCSKFYFDLANLRCVACWFATQSNCKKAPCNASFVFDSVSNLCVLKSNNNSCSSATTADVCQNCPFYYFNSSKPSCNPCTDLNKNIVTTKYNYTIAKGRMVIGCIKSLYNISYTRLPVNQCRNVGLTACNSDQCNEYFFQNNSCIACENADAQSCKQFCPYFAFNLATNYCFKCSTSLSVDDCAYCALYYFDNITNKCVSCADRVSLSDTQLLNSSVSCLDSLQFNLPRLILNRSPLRLLTEETMEKKCKQYTNFIQCNDDMFCYFSRDSNKCLPCSTANNAISCAQCSNYYFNTSQGFCVHCRFVNQSICSNCVGYQFSNSTNICDPTYSVTCSEITDEHICSDSCLFYFFDRTHGICTDCETYLSANINRTSNHFDGSVGENFVRCQKSFSTLTSCNQITDLASCLSDKCNNYFFNSRSCVSCDFANEVECFNCINYSFNNETNLCVLCSIAAGKSDCESCPFFYYDDAQDLCISCVDAFNRKIIPKNTTIAILCIRSLTRSVLINNNSFGFFSLGLFQAITFDCKNLDESTCTSARNCYFVHSSASNLCLSCANAASAERCANCPTYYFDSINFLCFPCQFANQTQCQTLCLTFAFDNVTQLCVPKNQIQCLTTSSQQICNTECQLFYFDSTTNKCGFCNNYADFPTDLNVVPSKAVINTFAACFLDLIDLKGCRTSNNLTCNSIQCLSFFYKSSSKVCSHCEEADSSECLSCSKYSYNTITKACVQCIFHESPLGVSDCNSCPLYYYDSNFLQCYSCIESQQVSGLTDTQLQLCLVNLQNNFLSSQDPYQYFVSKAIQDLCPQANQIKCKASSLCYYKSNSNQCVSCYNARSASDCKSCSKFYFDGTNCLACSFTSKTNCAFCPGYIFNLAIQTCIEIAQANCLVTTSSTTCNNNCLFSYFSTDTRKCQSCRNALNSFINSTTPGYTSSIGSIFMTCLQNLLNSTLDKSNCTAQNTVGCQNDACLSFYYSSSNTCSSCESANQADCLNCFGYNYNQITKTCVSCTNPTYNDCPLCILYYTNDIAFTCDSCPTLIASSSLTLFQLRSCAQSIINNAHSYPSNFNIYQVIFTLTMKDVCSSLSLSATTCNTNPLCYYSSTTQSCISCADAKTKSSCDLCNFYYFDSTSNNCILCSFAPSTSCNLCANFQFNNFTQVCSIISKAHCPRTLDQNICSITCPFSYFNQQTHSCQSCIILNNYVLAQESIDRISNILLTCERNLLQITSCSAGNQSFCFTDYCLDYFYTSEANTCVLCENAFQSYCILCALYTFNLGSQTCAICNSDTKQSDCIYCGFYFYDQNLLQCKTCVEIFFNNSATLAQGTDCVNSLTSNIAIGNYPSDKSPQQIFMEESLEAICPKLTTLQCKQAIYCYISKSTQSCLPCHTIKNLGYCSFCSNSYFDTTNQRCSECIFANADQCKLCSNFIFDPDSQKCILIEKRSCQTTTSLDVCSTCSNFYFDSNRKACLSCSLLNTLLVNGTSYSDYPTIFAGCAQSYKVFLVCPIRFCSICQNTTLKTCIKCLSGFILSIDSKSCVQNCSNLTNCQYCENSTCLLCSLGYALINQKCQKRCSITNCTTCLTQTLCNTCSALYLLSTDAKNCISCGVANCQFCQNAVSCASCLPGYVLFLGNLCILQCPTNSALDLNQNCQICSASIGFCNSCFVVYAQTFLCTECISGYYITNDGLCAECSSQIPNCFTCSSQTVCLTCYPGYRVSSNASLCLLKPPCNVNNCARCFLNSSVVCSRCEIGFNLTISRSQCLPINCNSAAHLTFDGSICSCMVGYYSSSGSCLACIQKCISCGDSVSCLTCNAGLFFNGTVCAPCILNCVVCTAAVNCAVCDIGYTFVNGTCIYTYAFSVGFISYSLTLCNYDCSVCNYVNKKVICLIPSLGYVFALDGSIISCKLMCQTCLATDPTICLSCNPSYYYNGTYCLPCSDPQCNDCSLSVNYCSKCKQGYGLQNQTCLPCSANCLDCSSSGPGKCDTCFAGYLVLNRNLNNDKLCSVCLNSCSICADDDPSICLQCNDGQYFDSTLGYCLTCVQNCKLCTNQSICLGCFGGYQIYKGLCEFPINPPCQSSQNNFCSQCYFGYTLASGDCIGDVSCNRTSACKFCPLKYYLRKSNCFSCPTISNCVTCNPITISLCALCKVGFYLDDGGVCQACSSGCAICATSTVCYLPASNFYLEKNNGFSAFKILPCNSNCFNCTNDPFQCTSCNTGYQLVGSKCRSFQYATISTVLNADNVFTNFSSLSLDDKKLMLLKNYNVFFSAFLSLIGQSAHPQLVNIKTLTVSSINVEAEVSPSPDQNADVNAFFNSLIASLTTGTSNGGFIVAASSVQAVGFTPTPTNDKGPDLGLILGIILPLLAVVAIFIAFLIYRNRQSKRSQEEGQALESQQKIESAENIHENDLNDENEQKKEKDNERAKESKSNISKEKTSRI